MGTAKRSPRKRSRAKAPLASVVIPVYNEEALLKAAVADLRENLNATGWNYELLITENGSTDRTREIALELERKHPEIRVLHTAEPNYGKALRRGIEEARGTFVLCDEIDICDVGFHRRAMAILQADQADMVIGSKLHPDARDDRPPMRHVATIVINGMLRIMLDFKGSDTHGLKAFRRTRLLPVVGRCIVDKDLFASELVIRAEREGVQIEEIPIEIIEKRTTSINLVRRVPNVIRNLVRLTVAIRFGKEL